MDFLEIHAAHAAARGHAGAGALVLLRQFGDHGFGGDQESRDGRRVLDRRTNHLGRVDTTLVGSMMPLLPAAPLSKS